MIQSELTTEASAPAALCSKDLLAVPSNVKPISKAWSYNRQSDGKDEWLTPPEIIWSLSESSNGEKFDLDPCAPVRRPWDTAKAHYSIEDNGLIKPWSGRVWCNPPYDNRTIDQWVKRCVEHDNAVMLVFARTETKFWKTLWNTADAILFLHGRMTFHEFVCAKCGQTVSQHKTEKSTKEAKISGAFENSGKAVKAQWTGGAGSALIAWGECNVDALEHANQECEVDGNLIYLGA